MLYIEGDATDLTWSFTDRSTGLPADPSTLVLKVRSPRAGVTTYTYGVDQQLVRDAEGEYSFHLDLNPGGFWRWRLVSTGVAQRAMQRGIQVKPAVV
jgi:hypothetical protein